LEDRRGDKEAMKNAIEDLSDEKTRLEKIHGVIAGITDRGSKRQQLENSLKHAQ